VRAAGAVGRPIVKAFDGDGQVTRAVEEPVHRLEAVPSRDDHDRSAESVQGLGELAPVGVLAVRHADKQARLDQVRSHDGGERKEPSDKNLDRIVAEEPSPRCRCDHGIDDERHRVLGQEGGHRVDHGRGEEHPRLRSVDANVREDRLELCLHELRRHLVNGRHGDRVLRGESDDRAHAVAAERRKRLQVGLDAGAAAGVGARDREAARHHWTGRLPSAPMTTLALDDLLAGDEVVYRTEISAQDARSVPLPDGLHPRVVEALARQGVDGLYTHQASAFGAALRGDNLMVSTGTASGKTLAFNLPVLHALAAEPKLRALYLYPTKALAQDQARALGELRVPRLRAAIYDGDTPSEQRWQIRKWANLILTNPDMLHVGVLPHHDRWGDVLANLRYVVVDEAHIYRGVFGSHVGNVLRRLRRTARTYGAEPQFLLASATIANPGEQARALLGLDVTVIADDGAPRAERTIAFWNPPVLDEELGLRASPLGDASRILAALVSRGLRTICFTKSRKAAELIHRFACDRVGAELAERLSPYRAGYTPAQRREIERRLVQGELLGVTATDALELGIDIGLLDCALSVGFPGTVASLRQQWGRAGRRGHGLAVLVASEDALDQFFMREPELLMGRRVEAAILDHANPRILDGHVRAAAFEAPIDSRDAAVLGPEALERAAVLAEAGELAETKAGFVWKGRDYPAARVSLRSTGPDLVSVVDAATGTVLGLVERERTYSTVHEGAIYLHLGESYRVLGLDLDARAALVESFQGDYYTQPKKETTTAIERVHVAETKLGLEVSFGDVVVTEQVVAFQKKATRDGENLELVALDLPETSFQTEAVWLLPEPSHLRDLEKMPLLLSTLHAAEHSLIALLPLWAMCDRWDIGGLSTNVHFQTGRPTIFVYDGHPGGVGISERGFLQFEGWVADTERLLAGCPCREGCPSCVQSPKCGNLNDFLDKAGALLLLRRMLARQA